MAKEWAKAFYSSKAWQKTRYSYIKDKHGICERCGNIGEIVHHKIRLNAQNINNPDVSLNKKNLELVCWVCHNKIDHDHLEDDVNKFNDDGEYMPPIKS